MIFSLFKSHIDQIYRNIIIRDIFKELRRINSEGVTILLVEQNARQALLLSHRGYVLQTGSIIMAGTSEDLLNSADIRNAYLGAGRKKGGLL